jgi:hypothetical protein
MSGDGYVLVIFWLVVGASIISFLWLRARMHTDKVLQSLAEKGLPILPELFRRAQTQDTRAIYLARGLILISVGLATALYFWAMSSGLFSPDENKHYLPFLGAFPLFPGIACIIIGLMHRPHD